MCLCHYDTAPLMSTGAGDAVCGAADAAAATDVSDVFPPPRHNCYILRDGIDADISRYVRATSSSACWILHASRTSATVYASLDEQEAVSRWHQPAHTDEVRSKPTSLLVQVLATTAAKCSTATASMQKQSWRIHGAAMCNLSSQAAPTA